MSSPLATRIDIANAAIEEMSTMEMRDKQKIITSIDEVISHAEACKKQVQSKMEKEKNESSKKPRSSTPGYEPSGD